MTENKFTDAEIIKALECCNTAENNFADCGDCPYHAKGTCIKSSEIFDFVSRLQAEKEALIAGQETLQKTLAEKNAEIERFKKIEKTINTFWSELKKLIIAKGKETPTLEELLEHMETLKSEAIKEFAERLKAEADSQKIVTIDGKWAISQKIVDDITKEMAGDAE